MKITSNNTKKSSKAVVITIIAIVLAAAIGVSAYAFFNNNSVNNEAGDSNVRDGEINFETPTEEQQENSEDIKKNAVENDNTGTPSSLTLSINSYQKTNTTTRIDIETNTIINTGKCTLIIKNGSVTKEYSADIQALPQYSTCKGFDITNSDLGSGTWSISATITTDNLTGTASKTIKIE